jgi:hypothetical protein
MYKKGSMQGQDSTMERGKLKDFTQLSTSSHTVPSMLRDAAAFYTPLPYPQASTGPARLVVEKAGSF